ncbi:MAG: Ribocuclease J [Candidatus Falkowbacteria bacterium GW2011_GWC2_38_22]|uniref:Ribonuclease J n=1 Tax=Candidatus Falkowbacteria bacterium GW2011_GWE1_38_31 TaxID=1618638 RepID=A0A0G0MZF0_9BACT|nr:MAG: Ribocuclease J [Candidatus Falkowbacteria bacterium GW2011_GWF2_38_1205]KKQ61019.1 MAG: Ribocuclease J [Candidatus Falkowbacteria bacterium GW2011_GWC2_38_22]KKQ63452.1 MAG: Ribocuclease J [Candidatus Falkowbacteria bacterium GW2011_GWF1_38_22]KKQ65477.1 MAG: Ribocuclease J [Candidatus Falkowbacteria bacterium GW2011_GWE2_38_254]KKQ70216.1 MAG: Ribocuclease J [Candidatus Falkowbacteria bacterium GW2011_GWE1_38_31]KKQ72608.1 MAG: Ribocuclease J [Candidatus Falkowbacteria bacterium GW201
MIKKYKSSSSSAAVFKKQAKPREDNEKNLTAKSAVGKYNSSDPNYKKKNGQENTIKATQVFHKDKLRVIVLGGLEEVGRNMTLIEYNQEIIIIDMGLMFPEEDMYGIDYIIPNISYLENKIDWIKGAVITHGHMDHIGGIPHIIGKIGNPPMFTGKLTAGLIRKRCEEHRNCPQLNIFEINETSLVQMGKSFKVEFLRVNHSVPDSFAVIIHTPIGTVIHTGDFKIDYSPVNDKPADLNRIAQIGGKGVLLMLSDSTDSTHPGYQVSESSIGDEMDKILENITGRVIIGTFASQLSRIQKLFDLAKKHNRKIYLQGRSMNDNVEIAHKIGYLDFNPRILANDSDINKLSDDKIMILGTGAQGETNAFLVRVVTGEHRTISLKKGDTVIFSSSVIPGNERSIQNLKDQVVRQGAHIIHYQMMDVHAGGHAKQEDLKLMMRLLKPKFFIPIEGSHYMLRAHAELAEQVGIPSENIFVPDNGQVVEISAVNAHVKIPHHNYPGAVRTNIPEQVVGTLTKEKVVTDYVMVDGLGVGDVSNIVLRDRRVMAEDGMIVVIATIDTKTGEPIGNPDIISRGFVYMKENRELIEKTRMKVKTLVKENSTATKTDDDFIKNKIRNEVGQFLFSRTKRRPMVLPVVIKV